MIYIGKLKRFRIKNGRLKLKVPFYHRSATGMLSGTELYAVPKINKSGQVKEIIFSPIPPKSWPFIWTFEITSSDRKGLIRDITEILSAHDINIMTHDFLTTKSEGRFHLKIIADINKFCALHPLEGHYDEIVELLHKKIVTPLTQINEEHKGKLTQHLKNRAVTVEFKPNEYLSSNSFREKDDENALAYQRKKQFLHDHCPVYEVRNHCIEIGRDILHDLELDSEAEVEGVIISDTEEKFMSLRFFTSGQKIVNLQIIHNNEPGAIFSFSDYILFDGHENFNIIACYNRLEAQKSRCHWFAIVDITTQPDAIFDFMDKEKWQTHAQSKKIHIPVQEVLVEYSKGLLTQFHKRLRKVIFNQYKRKLVHRLKKQFPKIAWITIIIILLAYIGILKNIFTFKKAWTVLFFLYGIIATIIVDIYYSKVTIEVFLLLSKLFNRKKKED